MKITRISAYQVDVPIKPATISHDRVMSVFDITYVRIETDAGIEGWGDSVPWGQISSRLTRAASAQVWTNSLRI